MAERLRRALVGACLVLVALAGCSGDDSDAAGPEGADTVVIATFQFRPNPLRVQVGADVTWTNTDDVLHTITSGTRDAPDDAFDGELDGPGTTFSFTFADPGTYSYFCRIHPGMDGQVTVE